MKKRTKKVSGAQGKNTNKTGQDIHHEDLALKTAALYFAEELMPLLGIRGAVGFIAPTEAVRLEARQMYQDFNYVTEDSAWVHLEFESDAVTDEDLRRFREYEAATSRAYHVEVITYVICSANVKRPKTVLREGINVYRVKAVQLKNKNADRLLLELKNKEERGELLTKEDLVHLLLTPLMSGKLKIEERILKSFGFLQKAENHISRMELEKMQAVLYTLADKFLDEAELNRVKEKIAMTRLGEMLVEDGMKKGMEKGIIETCRKLGLSFERTTDMVKQQFGISEEKAQKIVRQYWE